MNSGELFTCLEISTDILSNGSMRTPTSLNSLNSIFRKSIVPLQKLSVLAREYVICHSGKIDFRVEGPAEFEHQRRLPATNWPTDPNCERSVGKAPADWLWPSIKLSSVLQVLMRVSMIMRDGVCVGVVMIMVTLVVRATLVCVVAMRVRACHRWRFEIHRSSGYWLLRQPQLVLSLPPLLLLLLLLLARAAAFKAPTPGPGSWCRGGPAHSGTPAPGTPAPTGGEFGGRNANGGAFSPCSAIN